MPIRTHHVYATAVIAAVTIGVLVGSGIAIAMVLAVAAAAGTMAGSTVLHSKRGAQGRPQALAAPKSLGSLAVRVVFVATADQMVKIDAIAATDASGGGVPLTAGTPFALQLALPEEAWIADRVVDVLRRCADGNEVLSIELSERFGADRARLANDGWSVMLEVTAAQGIF